MAYERNAAAKYERIHLYKPVNDFNSTELQTLLASHFNKNAAKAETYIPSQSRESTPTSSQRSPSTTTSSDDNENNNYDNDSDDWNSVSNTSTRHNRHSNSHPRPHSNTGSTANNRRRGRDLLSEMYRSKPRV
ncbi:hypothetical protein CANINC_001167 [Pichia inconspicua]|uniref:Uncharacterized protein n=1 Tax=Pichia inconspicua TaxID=52247 RepID=A0A4T0X5K9_9ASCO|nr:hypothetical protein CANINC_001167 [[Candida] inconspicua]